jgi:signal peptide peptidase SppA
MPDGVTLSVPAFPRLDEFVADGGFWSVEPERFAGLLRLARGMNWAQHAAAFAAAPARPSNVQSEPARGGKSVAVISATGILMKQQTSMGGTSTVQLRRDVRTAAADPNVSAILLAVDSPGGTVAGTADLAAEVKAARRKKPVWAQITDLGASAAYWLASQADQVFASNATTQVGSIGTLQVVYDESAAAESAGIKTLVFGTGPLKGAGWPGSAVTDEQKANYQKQVDGIQAHFDAAVKAGRGMTQAQLTAVRTGGVWIAAEALALKLVDGVQPAEKTLADLANAR